MKVYRGFGKFEQLRVNVLWNVCMGKGRWSRKLEMGGVGDQDGKGQIVIRYFDVG